MVVRGGFCPRASCRQRPLQSQLQFSRAERHRPPASTRRQYAEKGAESVAMLRIAVLCGAAGHSNRGFAEPQGGGRKAELSPSVTHNQAVRFRLSRPNRDPPTGGEAGGTDSTGEASDEVNSLKTDPRKKRNLCRLPATEVPRNEVKSDKIVLLRPAVSASWPPGLAPPSPPQYPRSFVPPGLAPASWPPWSRPTVAVRCPRSLYSLQGLPPPAARLRL